MEDLKKKVPAVPTTTNRRPEALGPGWQERFVDAERAPYTSSVARAVADSLSYIVLFDFCTVSEREALLESAQALQTIYLQQGDADPDLFRGITVKWVSECSRYSVSELLNKDAQTASESMLQRLLCLLEHGRHHVNDATLSEVALQVFGTRTNLQALNAKWYNEMSYDKVSNPEPMVNIYEEGGYFKRHEDGMHMTLLVVLQNAQQGGGTAFYTAESVAPPPNPDDDKDDDITHTATASDNDHPLQAPERTECPPVGTALIWGGNLLHSALPVDKGGRTVFVGSFDLVCDDALNE